MSKEKLTIPKKMELIFDTLYLLIAFSLGLYFLTTTTNNIHIQWGVMALVLATGDSCHLIPRMAVACTGEVPRFQAAMGYGKMITSITMTVFYVLLWHGGLLVLSLERPVFTSILYVLAIVRIILCLFPQNQWSTLSPSYRWSIYRNIPFVLQGGMVMWLFMRYSSTIVFTLSYMWLAIFLSFACYLPVVLFASKKPIFGMLMLPKSCAYIWIICMGFGL